MNNILSYRVLLYIYIYNISFSKKFNVLYFNYEYIKKYKNLWVGSKKTSRSFFYFF